jgi:hypothetical protein
MAGFTKNLFLNYKIFCKGGERRMKKNNLILTIIVMFVVGGLAFWSGVQYQKKQRVNIGSGQLANGAAAPVREMPGRNETTQLGRAVNGEIISVEVEPITIKTQDDDTKIVVYSDSTRVSKTSEGSIADLQIGEQVTVVGAEDTSGVVTAQNISIGEGLFRQFSSPSGDN